MNFRKQSLRECDALLDLFHDLAQVLPDGAFLLDFGVEVLEQRGVNQAGRHLDPINALHSKGAQNKAAMRG
jgi:hypothetical protein